MVSFFLKNIGIIYLQYLSFPLKSGLTAHVSLRLCAGGIATVKSLLLMAEGRACGLADSSCGRVDAILMSVVHHTCKFSQGLEIIVNNEASLCQIRG